MLTLFRTLVERIKAMLTNAAVLDLESEYLSRDAERRAELLRLAERYESENLPTVAEYLRHQAEGIRNEMPALTHMQGGSVTSGSGVVASTKPSASNGRKTKRS